MLSNSMICMINIAYQNWGWSNDEDIDEIDYMEDEDEDEDADADEDLVVCDSLGKYMQL